ncbi:MAG: hypothetical protein HZB33_12940 [Nitrospirae bacterium]|nr:hypothetical protein [Nitrospirota bacterium]
MKRLKVNLDEIQKATEDIEREAFEYFLDKETGDVVILSEDIIAKARVVLADFFDEDVADFDEIESDEDYTMPEWIEDEVELALDIFVREQDRYVRIPERRSGAGYEAMRKFAEGLKNAVLKGELDEILEGKGAFRKFKDALEGHPKEKKQWYTLNARSARGEILKWLASAGIEPDKNGGNDGTPDQPKL